MASFIGSINHTPSLEVSSSASNRRITPTTTPSTSSLSLPFLDRSHFNAFVVAGRPLLSFKYSFVPRAIATPNSVLSEQAFKGLNIHEDRDDEQDDYDSSGETGAESSPDHDDGEELDISNLGLPQRLVDSLLKRGISHMFPIQVQILLLFLFYDFVCNSHTQ